MSKILDLFDWRWYFSWWFEMSLRDKIGLVVILLLLLSTLLYLWIQRLVDVSERLDKQSNTSPANDVTTVPVSTPKENTTLSNEVKADLSINNSKNDIVAPKTDAGGVNGK